RAIPMGGAERTGRSRALSAVLSVVLLAPMLPATARAQDDTVGRAPPGAAPTPDARTRAREKFVEASAAHERGDFQNAARLFEEAYRIVPRAAVKYNAGISWDRTGDHVRAADAYESALDMGGLEEQEAVEARERLGALKRELGYVSIDEPVGGVATIAHVERATVPVRLHVMPGTYHLRVESAGRSAEQDVRAGAGEVVDVRLALPALPQPPAAVTKAALPPAPRKDRPEHRSSGPSPWAWVGIGGGVALSGLAIFLGVRALDERD